MTELAIIGLGAWRLALLLTSEGGPFEVFERWRRFVGVPAPGEAIEGRLGFLATLFTCLYCMTAWTAAAMWAINEIEPRVALVLAGWGLALGLGLVLNRLRF
jgi:hypothetical protein